MSKKVDIKNTDKESSGGSNAFLEAEVLEDSLDDEEILLGHSVFLQDFDQRGKQKKLKGHAGAGSNNLWNFADSV